MSWHPKPNCGIFQLVAISIITISDKMPRKVIKWIEPLEAFFGYVLLCSTCSAILPARCRWWLENCTIPFARVNCTSLHYSAEMDSSGRVLRLWKFSPLTLTNFPSNFPADVTSTPRTCRQPSSSIFCGPVVLCCKVRSGLGHHDLHDTR